ncbi:hypothetical protein SIN8267_02693 [Sinobacterium norvegicum]|uniref:DUF4381 domain-containing protein n=1 Tax=Sinobacterium norvegicum TaxID=1641715 RepID=A0ABM9AH84_9GAMM|nr:DUF4381 domain-containing protein [Sinobacterium norvegicum]CAH0992560.1 hypothetical protein SIN8267_02693 [Sinobacterium norvegicum]
MPSYYESHAGSYMLRNLEKNPLPEAVSWWPQTWGWGIVAICLVAVSAYGLFRFGQYYWRSRYRREAMAALQHIDCSQPIEAAYQLNRVIKLTAAYAYPHQPVAGMLGEPLLAFLTSSSTQSFNGEMEQRWQQQLLLPPAHQTVTEAELLRLKKQLQLWVKQHRPGGIND